MDAEKLSSILKSYGITKYSVVEGGSINVYENVDISNKMLSSLEVEFNVVEGNFEFSSNEFEDFKNFPTYVTGNFVGGFNPLKSLEGFPYRIGGVIFLRPVLTSFEVEDILKICDVNPENVFLNQIYNSK